jgi:hypothetical protein
LRDADFGCGTGQHCYDPPWVDGSSWGWPEILGILIVAALVLALIWAILNAADPPKPKPSLREAVLKVVTDAEAQAANWNNPQAASAFSRARSAIEKEFADRGVT